MDKHGVALEDVEVPLRVAGRGSGGETSRTAQRSSRKASLLARSAAPDGDHRETKS
jgi:hypothetical protein